VGVDLKSKVLESVAVPHRPGRVGLSHADDTRILARGVVLDDALADLGDVEETVEKIGCPVEVGRTVGDVVTEHAHALQRAAELVRQVADDGLGGCVFTTPVTGPSCSKSVISLHGIAKSIHTWQAAVAVDVVAAEEDARLVAVNDLGEPAERLAGGRVAEVLLVDGRRVAPAEDVVARLPADRDGLVKTVLDVGPLGGVAGCVDGVLSHGAGVPCGVHGRSRGRNCNSHHLRLTSLVLAGEQRVGDGSRSSKEHERGVSDHDEAVDDPT